MGYIERLKEEGIEDKRGASLLLLLYGSYVKRSVPRVPEGVTALVVQNFVVTVN